MIGGGHPELTNEIRMQSNELNGPKLIGPSSQTSFSRTFDSLKLLLHIEIERLIT